MTATDGFLLSLAEVSAGLIGLFLVGMIFYIQTGFRQLEQSRSVVEPYFRASTRIVLIVYSVPLAVSLTLVSLPIGWSRIVFWGLILALLAANVSTIGGLGPVMNATRSRLLLYNEIVGTAGVLTMVVVTLVLGGVLPSREELVPALLLGLGLGFLSTCVLVLTLFDIAEFERAGSTDSETPVRFRLWRRAVGAANDPVGDDLEVTGQTEAEQTPPRSKPPGES